MRDGGAADKKNVVVMTESTPLEDFNTGKKSKHICYFKAKVLETHKSSEESYHRRIIK